MRPNFAVVHSMEGSTLISFFFHILLIVAPILEVLDLIIDDGDIGLHPKESLLEDVLVLLIREDRHRAILGVGKSAPESWLGMLTIASGTTLLPLPVCISIIESLLTDDCPAGEDDHARYDVATSTCAQFDQPFGSHTTDSFSDGAYGVLDP